MAKTIHTMIRVLDLDRSIEFYRASIGLEVAGRFDFESFTIVYLRNDESDFELELVHNVGHEEPYDHGNAYGHLAVAVDDLVEEHGRLAHAGLEPEKIKELQHEGEILGRYFFVSDPDGYRVEILERAGRFA